jgi:ubiquinone/menaquinone biosynthesis C-methylase UbiE
MIPADPRKGVTAYWDNRAPAFNGVASHVGLAQEWRAVFAAAFQADGPKDVIDFGTGTGACAILAAELGHRVHAYDDSEGMLAVAHQAALAATVTVAFQRCLIEEARIAPASADIVTIRNVLWTLSDPMAALMIAYHALRPGGLVLVSDALWSVAPQHRSTYPSGLASALPLHAGLSEERAREMLNDAGFASATAWQHLFPTPPYPGAVPMFVLTARKG